MSTWRRAVIWVTVRHTGLRYPARAHMGDVLVACRPPHGVSRCSYNGGMGEIVAGDNHRAKGR
jgi:hypothetical protein